MTDQPVIATFLGGPPQEIKHVQPFTPDEAHEAFLTSLPREVIEEVNLRLQQNLFAPDEQIIIDYEHLRESLVQRGLSPSDIAQNNWTHFESLYRRRGWKVKRQTDQGHYWTFTRAPSAPARLNAPAQINLNWYVVARLTSVGEAELARFAPDSSGTVLMTRAQQPDGSYKLPLYQLISIFGHLMPRHAGTDTTPFETMLIIDPTQ